MRAAPLFFAAAAALALVAACSRREPAAPPVEAPVPVDVAAMDELAALPAPATGLAFWSHPTLPFNSLAIAATGEGVIAYNIEDGEEVARLDGIDAGGVAVAYRGQGPMAEAAAAVFDRAKRRFVFITIDNIDRSFAPGYAPISFAAPVDGFCFGHSRNEDGLTLYVLSGGTLAAYAFAVDGAGAGGAQTFAAPEDAAACAVDDVDGAVFVATKAGEIYRFDRGAGFEAPFARSAAVRPVSIGVALNGLVEGAPTDQCCGQIALLDGEDGLVHLFDREDGRALGAVRLIGFDEIEGVGAATAMAAGYANYGGVYRSGALALATNGAAPALRLTPLNGAASALAFALGDPADPRALSPQEEEPVIDIELVNP